MATLPEFPNKDDTNAQMFDKLANLRDYLNTLLGEDGTIETAKSTLGLDNALLTDGAQTISGVKTFSVLPESSVPPSADNQLVNKAYADSIVQNKGDRFIYKSSFSLDTLASAPVAVGDEFRVRLETQSNVQKIIIEWKQFSFELGSGADRFFVIQKFLSGTYALSGTFLSYPWSGTGDTWREIYKVNYSALGENHTIIEIDRIFTTSYILGNTVRKSTSQIKYAICLLNDYIHIVEER